MNQTSFPPPLPPPRIRPATATTLPTRPKLAEFKGNPVEKAMAQLVLDFSEKIDTNVPTSQNEKKGWIEKDLKDLTEALDSMKKSGDSFKLRQHDTVYKKTLRKMVATKLVAAISKPEDTLGYEEICNTMNTIFREDETYSFEKLVGAAKQEKEVAKKKKATRSGRVLDQAQKALLSITTKKTDKKRKTRKLSHTIRSLFTWKSKGTSGTEKTAGAAKGKKVEGANQKALQAELAEKLKARTAAQTETEVKYDRPQKAPILNRDEANALLTKKAMKAVKGLIKALKKNAKFKEMEPFLKTINGTLKESKGPAFSSFQWTVLGENKKLQTALYKYNKKNPAEYPLFKNALMKNIEGRQRAAVVLSLMR